MIGDYPMLRRLAQLQIAAENDHFEVDISSELAADDGRREFHLHDEVAKVYKILSRVVVHTF